MSQNYDFAKKKLMTPGPVPLPQYVKDSFSSLECHHRSKEFGDVLKRVFENLKKVFQTSEHCFLLPCTGTGAMEASLINTLSPGDSLLSINSGKFGERWGKIAKAFGIEVTEFKVPWGEAVDLELLKEELGKKEYKALALQACETSTGALLPVKEIGEITKETNTLLIVDGITALGAIDIPMDQWGIDVLIGGSQKAFMLPTGMAFLSLSQKAQKRESTIPKYYWDLKAEMKSNQEGKTRYSTPSHFIMALDLVLDEMVNQKGVQQYFALIQERADVFRKEVNMELFPKRPSSSLTCLKVPENVSAQEIKKTLSERGITIVAGQDQLKDKVLRVGHMGAMTLEDLKKTAQEINRLLP